MTRSILVFTLIAVTFCVAVAQNELPIRPSTVEDQLMSKLEADPRLTPAELATLGNKLAESAGYPFGFAPDKVGVASAGSVKYSLIGRNGRRATFVAPEPGDHPCGIATEFPISAATTKAITIVVEGRQFEMVMPNDFIFDEVNLVDASLKRILRTWVVPMDHTPEAISRDGTKVYVTTFSDDLFLEIDQRGRYKYVARGTGGMLVKGTDLKKFPKEKGNDYLGFRRFKSAKQNYTLKFSHPCT